MTFRSAGSLVVFVGLVAAAAFRASAQQPAATPEARLGAALHHAEVTGDLEKAVAVYREVIADRSATRATIASALVGLGTVYEKLGRPEARAQYERVIAEFADQASVATTARNRLAASTPAAAGGNVSLRRIWAGSNNVSRDGRFLIHAKGMRDLVAGVDIALPVGDIHRGVTVLSPDTTQVVFESCAAFGECELRIADRGQPNTSRRLYQNPDVRLSPQDWSADGKWIAVTGSRADSSGHIGLLRMPEGTLTVLKSTDWRRSTALLFSPDGRYLAFDIAVDDQSPSRDVYAIAVDGSREIPIAVGPAHEAIMGWSPDGRRLLFASDRGGSMDLWSLAIADGQPQGAPERLRSNIGNVRSMRVATNGALYLQTEDNERDVAVVSLDPSDGSQTSPSARPVSRYPGTNFEPAWSADGSRLAYVSQRGVGDTDLGELVLGIRDSSGETRELQPRPRLTVFVGPSWSRDGRSIAVTGVDAKGRAGIFRVDASTGDVTPIASPIPWTYERAFWSPDERRIYYRALDGKLRERDVATGDERVILDESGLSFGERIGPISVSPDGRWIATYRSSTVLLLPIDGGQPRELHRFAPREAGNKPMVINNNPMPWTPDGRSLLVWLVPEGPACGTGHACQTELWQIPTDGSSARKLDVALDGAINGQLGKLRLNPDGRQLAYVAGRSYQRETWVLENFLPSAR